ncbi:glycosyl hydrolase 53 family protein [Streptomyces sp. B1866]|uniref:glycoside hydrolase family 53 protein n=1 Tax=Streptomyces sp. B1866 TaxID=3075431 RepID=UPI002890D802|nr:glycosyl hydrolase 53 family protein [Streptomyces sp. B1866]MDT3396015.1 glycosyl hydrolase 53 family protein [Streptomyces sp. B1866]
MLSRRSLLSTAPLLTLAAAAACAGPSPRRGGGPRPLRGALAVRGADLSSLPQEEAAGRRFGDAGRTGPAERLLAARGATAVRLRVWVDPGPDGFGLAAALHLARRAHAAGLRVVLDLHYSDSWADTAHQTTPKAWAGQDLRRLAATVRDYTRDVVEAFAAQRTPADMVQIGNEISHGMLWPHGRIDAPGREERWDGFRTLLAAGLRGAAEASAPPRTAVHIDAGGDNARARRFYDHLAAAGVPFDVIALSYYPFWHGSLAALQYNLTDLAARYGKDVLVAETAYPWKLPADDGCIVTRADQLPDVARFPATPAGQAAYFEALRALLADLPGGRGLGFLAWEPAWVPGVRANRRQERLYANLTMFDWSGAGLPSLAAFRPR